MYGESFEDMLAKLGLAAIVVSVLWSSHTLVRSYLDFVPEMSHLSEPRENLFLDISSGSQRTNVNKPGGKADVQQLTSLAYRHRQCANERDVQRDLLSDLDY